MCRSQNLKNPAAQIVDLDDMAIDDRDVFLR